MQDIPGTPDFIISNTTKKQMERVSEVFRRITYNKQTDAAFQEKFYFRILTASYTPVPVGIRFPKILFHCFIRRYPAGRHVKPYFRISVIMKIYFQEVCKKTNGKFYALI